jgi:hypothetical protein
MRVSSEAHVSTQHGRQYLSQVTRQLEQRARAKPELGVTIERTDADATIDFGWARCALDADETSLVVRVEADDEDALGQVCELIVRHLTAHAKEPFAVTWSHHGTSDTRDDRRDRMRSFHARMRQGPPSR